MKKTISQLALIIFCLSISHSTTFAQFGNILGDLAKDVVDEVTDEVSEEISRRIAEEVAKQAVREVNEVMDSIFHESYEKDSVEYAKLGKSYEDFLLAMNESANLPATYQFDVQLKIEMKDYDGEKNTMLMYLSKNSSLFGIKQLDKKEESDLVIIDAENDIIAMYDEEKNTVQALPNMMSLAGAMAQTSMEGDISEYTLERTSKTKKIAGYKTVMFNTETEDETGHTYIAEDFPIDWRNSIAKMGKDFVPPNYLDQIQEVNGFMLQSESKFKSNGKKSSWETKKVEEKTFVIDNSKFAKTNLGEE